MRSVTTYASGYWAGELKGGDAMYVTYEGLCALTMVILGVITLCVKLLKK